MKKSRKWLLRFTLLVVIISVFFICAVSASAASPPKNIIYDSQRFITNVSIVGEGEDAVATITYSLVSSRAYIYVFNADNNYEVIYSGEGVSHPNIPFQPGVNYRISICPLGYRDSTNGFDTYTLPSAFSLNTGFGFLYDEYEESAWQKIIKPSGYYRFYSSGNNTAIQTQQLNIEDQNGKTHITSSRNPVTVPNGAKVMNFEFLWDDVYWQDYPCPTGLTIDDFTMTTVAYGQEALLFYKYWTNGMLGNIQDGLFGDFNPIIPPNAGDLEDLERFEEDLLDHIEGEIGAIDNLMGGFNAVVHEIGPSLLFVSWILDLFISISFFSKLINVVIALGITAFVLNLLMTVISRSTSEKNKSSEAHKDQKGG